MMNYQNPEGRLQQHPGTVIALETVTVQGAM